MRRLAILAAAVLAACSTEQCRSMKGNPFSALFCGGEGADAPLPDPVLPSACQPRAVMPHFFALIDGGDPALAGLREAVKDIGTPVCLIPDAQRACSSDDQCEVGGCTQGLCACSAEYSPLADVLGLTMRGLASVADDAQELGAVAPDRCVSAAAAASLAPAQRNRMCELRRSLDVLLQQNGGQTLIGDPATRTVLLSLLDYVEGTRDGHTHYELLAGVGRMAAAQTRACDPAAPWTLADRLLTALTPDVAARKLAAVQALLADPYTQQFLLALSQAGGTQGRDSFILLVHGLTPSLVAARSGADALAQVNQLLQQLVYGSSSVPDRFKNEVRAVIDETQSLLGPDTGVFPPLQKLLACAADPTVRCSDPAQCTSHDDELLGAAWDLLSRSQAQGGVDLATLVGALQTMASLDASGQVARSLRLIVQAVEGSPDPTEPHDARDALGALARDSLQPAEMQKLLPAVHVLLEQGVVTELLGLVQDLLYTCKPPPTAPIK